MEIDGVDIRAADLVLLDNHDPAVFTTVIVSAGTADGRPACVPTG
jgi:hypothetical protein